MLLERGDGTFDGGMLDVICILHDRTTDKYHAAFFEEHPLPSQAGIPINELPMVRLMSKMHHTDGSDSFEAELVEAKKLSEKIHLPEKNLWLKEAHDWDGQLGIVWIVPSEQYKEKVG